MNEKKSFNFSFPVANVESALCHALEGTKEGKRLDTRCSIKVHSKRTRLADPDGVSAKALIDGLRKAGILIDDSAKFIKEVSYSQEIAKNDETIVTIEFGGYL